MTPDVATLAARVGAALRLGGVPVTPDQCARFARALTVVEPPTPRTTYWTALATLTSDPSHTAVLAAALTAAVSADHDVDSTDDRFVPCHLHDHGEEGAAAVERVGQRAVERVGQRAVDVDRLGQRDFGELTPEELATLADVMRQMAVATPPRRSRRVRSAPHGPRVDLRATLRAARRTGGFPVAVARRDRRSKPRRLVVLCDISGSMEPYARAMLQLLYCAAGGSRAEVFTFATRLTRLTRVLHRLPPAIALERAGRAAPDWAGGTRIGVSLKDFNDRHGVPGLARGAVVLVVSDGWETGDAARLGREMARLSRVAYRVVWANPRTASPRYQPLAAGMAAAWPYCDAVVSAHSLKALDELLAAIRATRGARPAGPLGTASSPRGRPSAR